MLSSLINNPFFFMALFASFLASITSGVIGSFVVIKRISFLAGSIAHSILGGMGVCLWLQRTYGLNWCDPILGAFISAIVSAIILGWIHLNYRQREDSIIAAIWTTGMAIGLIFISLTPGSNVEIVNYLFGNILFIDTPDLIYLGLLNAGCLLIVSLGYKKFLAICFDEKQALLQGIPIQKLYLLLLCLVAISIVLLMQIIGIILVIALLTIPATISSLFTSRLFVMMALASLFSSLFCFVGISISFTLNLPPSATIALVSAICYFGLLSAKKKKFALQKR